jgi:3-oxoacyl-[acyl-carrier-protein] synthase-1
MSQALSMSGLKSSDIGYINVHGTGTPNNDASEGAALRRLFGDNVPAFSSTKSYTGHTLAAAGGIEAVFSVLSIDRGMIFPNLNFTTSIEGLGLIPEASFSEGNDISAVMSNSFGFGGNNSSLIFTKKDGSIHQ